MLVDVSGREIVDGGEYRDVLLGGIGKIRWNDEKSTYQFFLDGSKIGRNIEFLPTFDGHFFTHGYTQIGVDINDSVFNMINGSFKEGQMNEDYNPCNCDCYNFEPEILVEEVVEDNEYRLLNGEREVPTEDGYYWVVTQTSQGLPYEEEINKFESSSSFMVSNWEDMIENLNIMVVKVYGPIEKPIYEQEDISREEVEFRNTCEIIGRDSLDVTDWINEISEEEIFDAFFEDGIDLSTEQGKIETAKSAIEIFALAHKMGFNLGKYIVKVLKNT